MATDPPLHTTADAATLAADAAHRVATLLTQAVALRGHATLAVSGGRTPAAFLRALAGHDVDWAKVTVLQVDERFAPRGDPDRNRTGLESDLLAPLGERGTPAGGVVFLAVPDDGADNDESVAVAAAASAEAYAAAVPDGRIDVVHLGLGDDGHTASWPPGEALPAGEWVAATGVFRGRRRLTLTPAAVNRARNAVFVVEGADKAVAITHLLAHDTAQPAAAVRAAAVEVWADEAAAHAALVAEAGDVTTPRVPATPRPNPPVPTPRTDALPVPTPQAAGLAPPSEPAAEATPAPVTPPPALPLQHNYCVAPPPSARQDNPAVALLAGRVPGALGGAEPAAPLRQAMVVIGVDVGGSGIKGAPVDVTTGKLVADRVRIPTPQPATPKAVAATVAEVVDAFKGAVGPLDPEATVGITLPAVVTHGMVRTAANIDPAWIGTDAHTLFGDALGTPAHVLNDADAAGLAEARFGAGKGRRGLVVLVTVGTGLGTALVLDGVLVPNTELGHLQIGGRDAEEIASDRVRGSGEAGWRKWTKGLDTYLRELERLLWPDLVIIGGGVSKRSEKFLPHLTLTCPVVPAQLRNEAGIVGAALSAAE